MPSTYILIAQEAAAPVAAPKEGAAKGGAGPFGDPMFMMMLMGLAVVFLFILPARQQKKQQQLLLSNIKRGAKVVTVGGIIGTIVTIKDNEDEVTIRSEDAKFKITRASIARVLGQDESEAAKA